MSRSSSARLPDPTGRIAAVTGADSGLGFVTHNAEESALPAPHAATADLPGDSHAGCDRLRGMRGAPTRAGRAARARDGSAARRLRKVPEEPTGTRFPLDAPTPPAS
ncbi:hypothetical protein [Streptomyces sp. SAI-229]|uniref:hypothetical protein n=1 Tax=Streptomyces sp. SAI-229 TaxID=3377731 RepID=UPI003C7E2E95